MGFRFIPNTRLVLKKTETVPKLAYGVSFVS